MLLLSRNDCLPSSFPPISLHLCSSTHPLTSRASSTCLTRLSAPWCKERETPRFAPQGERKRDEEEKGEEEEVEATGRESPSPRSLCRSKPKLSFHRLSTELLRKPLAEEVSENTELAPFFKKSGLPDVRCSLSMHIRPHLTHIYDLFLLYIISKLI